MESTRYPVLQTPTPPTGTSPSSAPGHVATWTADAMPAISGERPAGGETLARAAQGAHHAIDVTVARVAPIVDGVHDQVESAKHAVSSTQEWVGAAREAIQARPFTAIAGAALVGAAWMSLRRR